MVSPYPNLKAIAYQELDNGIHEIKLLKISKQPVIEWLALWDELYQYAERPQRWRFLLDCSQLEAPPPLQYILAQLRHRAKQYRIEHLAVAILYGEDLEYIRLLSALSRTFNDVGRQVRGFSKHQRQQALAWLMLQNLP